MLSQAERDKLVQIAREAGITYLALFGSHARGEATPQSDVDLAVRFDRVISLFDLIDTQQAMQDAVSREIDLVPVDNVYDVIKPSIQREAVVLYQA